MYAEDQLNSENVKEKDQKLSFLQRLVDLTGLAIGQTIDCSPAKIVAGADAEKTNLLLQMVAKAANKVKEQEISMEELINALERGDKPGEKKSKSKSSAPVASPEDEGNFIANTQKLLGAIIQKPKLTEKLLQKPPFRFLHDIITSVLSSYNWPSDYFTSEELDSGNFNEPQQKLNFLQKWIEAVQSSTGVNLSSIQPKKIAAGLEPEQTNRLLQYTAKAASSGIQPGNAGKKQTENKKTAEEKKEKEKEREREKEKERAEREAAERAAKNLQSSAVPKLSLGTVAKESEDGDGEAVQNQEENSKIPSRPKTARPGPPALRTNAVEEKRKAEEAVKETAAAGAVILEGAPPEPEIEEAPEEPEEERLNFESNDTAGVNLAEAGGLMRKIVEATKGKEKDTKEDGKMRLASSKTSYNAAQIEELRQQIQKVCQSVNPLGKVIDFVFEDLDLMQKEFNRWRNLYLEYSEKLERERRTTEKFLEPLTQQLATTEEEYQEAVRRVQQMKAAILRNEQTIQGMLEQKSADGGN